MSQKNISIKNKLLFLTLIPIIALLYYVLSNVNREYNLYTNSAQIQNYTKIGIAGANLVHELQKERGFSAGYLGSKGKNFSNKLSAQHQQTDKLIVEFKDNLLKHTLDDSSIAITKFLNNALSKIENRKSVRSNVLAMSIETSKAISFYTSINNEILNMITEISKKSKEAVITKEIIAYSSFLQSKERAGIERAVGANTFSKDKFSKGNRTKLNNLIAMQNSYINTFLSLGSQKNLDIYNQKLNIPEIKIIA